MNIKTPSWTSRNFSSEMYDKKEYNPACEISESDRHYFMTVELPGMTMEFSRYICQKHHHLPSHEL